jgi:preprotein translocase subunit YajC
MRILVPLILIAVVTGIVLFVSRRNQRKRGDATPELHKHPERLDQSLDPTDDA